MTFVHIHPATRIVAGEGALDQLASECDRMAGRRAMVVCGRTVASGPQLTAARAALGDRLVEVFDGVRPHGGLSSLQAAADRVAALDVDILVSVGGGATIDSAKCIALLIARTEPLERYRVQRGAHGHVDGLAIPPTIAHVAIPTTAGSSSEIMPWAGIRDEKTRQKMLFRDPQLVPDVAILDPDVVSHTGPELTSSSAVTAIARAVECMYSRDRQPFAEAYALQSLRLMSTALPAVLADPCDLGARHRTQVAATLSGIAADNAMVSVVHAVGHSVGGRYALQHGVAHRMLLPGALERCLIGTGDIQIKMAQALDLDHPWRDPDDAGRAVSDRIGELLDALPLPRRLRDVGVTEDELDELVEQTHGDPMFAHAPASFGEDELRSLLREVW
ncbi:MAG: iron-containing alcohol dehydrogenase family protein [Ilumatobacteraceae bacterium]